MALTATISTRRRIGSVAEHKEPTTLAPSENVALDCEFLQPANVVLDLTVLYVSCWIWYLSEAFLIGMAGLSNNSENWEANVNPIQNATNSISTLNQILTENAAKIVKLLVV